MKKLLLLVLFILAGQRAEAQTLRNCLMVDTQTNQTASTNGTIVEFKAQNYRAVSFIATVNNDAGTLPTLDLKVQTCRTTATSSCKDLVTFNQFTTGSSFQVADMNRSTTNWFKYFRGVGTIGGSASPQFDYTVELCFDVTQN